MFIKSILISENFISIFHSSQTYQNHVFRTTHSKNMHCSALLQNTRGLGSIFSRHWEKMIPFQPPCKTGAKNKGRADKLRTNVYTNKFNA